MKSQPAEGSAIFLLFFPHFGLRHTIPRLYFTKNKSLIARCAISPMASYLPSLHRNGERGIK